jgi:hypothetical protein
MATFTRFMIAIVSVASGYAIGMAPASVLAEQSDTRWASTSELDELLQWHSGLTIESNVCIAPQRESAFTFRKLPETAALLALHGSPGTWDVAQSAASISPPLRNGSRRQASAH